MQQSDNGVTRVRLSALGQLSPNKMYIEANQIRQDEMSTIKADTLEDARSDKACSELSFAEAATL